MALRVLLVEDNIDLATSLIEYLKLEIIECDHAFNGNLGLQLATEEEFDVVLLDVMVPGLSGLNICEDLRGRGVDVPVLMLTARDTLDDKAAGFSAGADDYLVKPFAMQELLMRIKALAKRRSGQVRKYIIGDLSIDLDERRAFRDGVELKLTPTEWTVLVKLAAKSPDVVKRQSLERCIWGDDVPESNSLKVHLHKLRQKLDGPFDVPVLHTVAGVGMALRTDEG